MAVIFKNENYILASKFFTKRIYIASINTGKKTFPANFEVSHLLSVFQKINASRLTMQERGTALSIAADRFVGAIMHGNELSYEMFFRQDPDKYAEMLVLLMKQPQN